MVRIDVCVKTDFFFQNLKKSKKKIILECIFYKNYKVLLVDSANFRKRSKYGAHHPCINLSSNFAFPVATSVQLVVDTLHLFGPVGTQCNANVFKIRVVSFDSGTIF